MASIPPARQYTIPQFARLMGETPDKARRFLESKGFPIEKRGRTRVIFHVDLEHYLPRVAAAIRYGDPYEDD
jgi:hypothetical protein